MSNTKSKLTSTLLILSLVFTMFALNTIPANAATKKITVKASVTGQTTVSVTWNKISNPYSGYAVFRDGKVIKYCNTKTTKFNDSGLASGSAHSYQIKSYKKTKQYYNTKTKKWVNKKPKASQWKGKQTRYSYSYKTKSNVVSVRTNYAYYTITWKNWNGVTLATTSIRQGLIPSYSGTPSRPADTNYTYTFTGWSPSITVANGNKTYTAQYRAVAKPTYTVTWKNWDGTVLKTDSVKSGVVPSYTGSTPTKPEDVDNTYTFNGWSPSPSAVTNNVVYVAQFKTNPKPLYSITWNNWNGVTLKTDAVRQGVIPSYTGTTPKKTADDTYIYTFSGWSPTIVAANGNKTYTAQFTATRKYTITWKNWDDTVLRTDVVKEGVKPVYPGTPTRPEDTNYVYQFTGWDPVVTAATSNVTYTAQYTPVPKNTTFTIIWQNYDGTELKRDTVNAGDTPTYTGDTPTKPEDDNGVYEFKGWNPEISAITQNTTFIAQYKTYKKYTITWVNYDGNTLKTEKVKVGEIPSYTGDNPTKPETDEYTYTFIGWSPEIVAVSGNATYEANFKAVDKPEPSSYDYTIHLLNEPYGHGGETAVYIETNNPSIYNYELGILNSSNQEKKLNIYKTYYKGSSTTTTNYQDLSLPLSSGYLAICKPECSGNCTFVVYEYDDNGRHIAATKVANVKDYTNEETAWIQSVVSNVTNSSMSNSAKMNAICEYIDSNFNYTKVPIGSSPNTTVGEGSTYIELLSDVGVPYWVEKRLNSSTSPELLVKFGQIIGYNLHNCYGDYEVGSDLWLEYHYKVYSEADDLYFDACPYYGKGAIDPSSIVMFNPNTYNF